jgi:adenylate cyclase
MKRIQTLGGLAVFDGARLLGGSAQQPRRLAILAVLARAGGRAVSRDRLVALLWPDTDEERGRRSLNQALYGLRQELGSEEAILGTRDIRLNPDLVETDVGEFEAAAASGALEEAARSYRPFLGDFNLPGAVEFARWAEEEREALTGEYRRILEAVSRGAAGRGDWGGAVLWWRRRAAIDPDDGLVAQGLMLALAAAGDVPGALRHAEIFTELRQQELELPADPDVLTLAERIRRGELPPVPRPSAPGGPLQPVAPPSAPQPIAAPPGSQPATKPDAGRPASIAVLPFVNMSPDRENEYFSDGLTEELTNALTQVAGLRVASRTSAFAFKGKEVDARKIGARLGVTLLVEGSVRKLANRIRVTAQVINAADGYHLWSQAFDRTLTDVFALQEEVAHAIVAALLALGHGVGDAPRVRPPTDVVEAYTLYLRGRYFVLKGDADSLRVALEYFEQALELDPHYALAYAGVAQCWVLSGFHFGELPPLEAMPRAKLAVDRALELDPELAEGHVWRGAIAMLYEYDLVEADARLTRAIELQPSAIHAHVWRSILRSFAGRHDEAIAEALEAERLDPLAIRVQLAVGRCYHFAGRFDEATRRFQTVLAMDPNNIAHAWLARACNLTGRPDLGLAAAETGLARASRDPFLLEAFGISLAALGRSNEARDVIAELDELARHRYVSAYHVALIHGQLGEGEAAMRRLEEAARERSGYLPFSLTNLGGGFELLRETPHFRALMERLGLGMLLAAQGTDAPRQ